MIEPVSRARLTSEGAGGTAGRAPIVEPPTRSEQAEQLRAEIISLYEQIVTAYKLREAHLLDAFKRALKETYQQGFAGGQAQLIESLPAVVRETSFQVDKQGKIVGKVESEFRPGGKS